MIAAAGHARTRVSAICGEQAGFARIGEIRRENFIADAAAECGIFERKNYLDAFVEIARHPVRAAKKHFRLTAIFKIIDAAMFKIAANHAAHANAGADAAQTGNQGALPTNDKVDIHAGLRGAIESLNDGFIDERVHFDNDARGATAASVAGFAIDEGDAAFAHVARGDKKRLVVILFGVSGEEVEYILNGRGDFVVRGEQAEIGVETSGGRIVVAGTKMDVAANLAVGIVADDEQELGVGLKVHQAVGNLYAGVFKTARPADVSGFVKTGF